MEELAKWRELITLIYIDIRETERARVFRTHKFRTRVLRTDILCLLLAAFWLYICARKKMDIYKTQQIERGCMQGRRETVSWRIISTTGHGGCACHARCLHA